VSRLRIAISMALSLSLLSCAESQANQSQVRTEEEKVLYGLGLAFATSAARFNLTESELTIVTQGFQDGVLGRPELVPRAEYMRKVSDLAKARTKVTEQQQRLRGNEYRRAAMAQPGARQTESGLILIPSMEGSGNPPANTDSVTTRITITNLDGDTVFQSSSNGDTDVVEHFPDCLSEALLLLRPGTQARLICPPELVTGWYGENIKPGATLIFDIEFLATSQSRTPGHTRPRGSHGG